MGFAGGGTRPIRLPPIQKPRTATVLLSVLFEVGRNEIPLISDTGFHFKQ